MFCDASETAYNAVAYLKGKNEHGEVVTSFVASKSKVVPLKKISLLRLEQMGALIGARPPVEATEYGKESIEDVDSTKAYHWIRTVALQRSLLWKIE